MFLKLENACSSKMLSFGKEISITLTEELKKAPYQIADLGEGGCEKDWLQRSCHRAWSRRVEPFGGVDHQADDVVQFDAVLGGQPLEDGNLGEECLAQTKRRHVGAVDDCDQLQRHCFDSCLLDANQVQWMQSVETVQHGERRTEQLLQ